MALLVSGAQGSEPVRQVNPDTGLSTWVADDPVFSIELIQLIPDFVRAVYESKGLPKDVIESISRYCVFGTIIRNRANTPVSYDIRTWRYITDDGTEHVAKLKSAWLNEWHEKGIAFRWSLLHEAQTFAVGDWGQGFTTVNLPPETRFDLHYSWTQQGKLNERVIRGMACAPVEPGK